MRLWVGIIGFVLILFSCGNGGDEKPKPAPVFKSSIPGDLATDVSLSSAIEITFDEVVNLAANHGITVNGDAAEASILLTKLTIDLDLSYGTTYEIIIPKGAVINTFGVSLEDQIQLTFTTEEEIIVHIDENLSVSNSSQQAINLYGFLKDNYGTKAISAVQSNVSWNVNEAEWVYQHTGKYPAIATVDYIHLPFSPANWIDYSSFNFIENWWSNNGIVSAGWHWIVPKFQASSYSTDDYTYKPSETTFKAANVLIEGTWENEVATADLDKIASYLKLLQAKNIPVIWRPLHEAAGNIYEYNGGTAWFWWGAGGADTYKALWRMMYDYFEAEGLNNLIWVWTTQTKDHDFYPGDEYVDIIGRDIYTNTDADDISAQFKSIQELYPNKMVTLSEMGSVANFSDQWTADAKWSYFMPWYDYERTNNVNEADFSETNHEHANASWWTDAVSQDYVITRDEMPDLK